MVDVETVNASTFLTSGAKVVYAVMYSHRLPDTDLGYMTQRKIASATGISYRSVRNHIAELEYVRLIVRLHGSEYRLSNCDLDKLRSKRDRKNR